MPDCQKQKEEFLALCYKTIHRDGLKELLLWLCQSDFFEAPASTVYHGNYPGGLCEHCMDVYNYALRVQELSPRELNQESLAIACLFHDLCKVNRYFLQKSEDGSSKYSENEQFRFAGHGSKSVFLCQRYLPLTDEEAVAIHCHMGFSDGNFQVGDSFRHYPLAWVVHVADEAATYFLNR